MSGSDVTDVNSGEDPRAARCRPDVRRYLVLLAELGALYLVVRLYKLEAVVGRSFLKACGLAYAGFAVHYWLPLRLKEWFWIALSIGGGFWILEPSTALMVLAAGLVFYAVSALPVAWTAKVVLMLAVGAFCTVGRVSGIVGLPAQGFAVVGSVFLFRLLVWAYDLKHMERRPPLKEYLAYFFMLPNWGCLLFPVVDFQTQRRSFLARDHHDVAQRGVEWMTRGAIHLLIYVLIYYRKPVGDPGEITTGFELFAFIVTTFLLYLRVSGTFHFVVGVLHLFGYDLPETQRRWLLASSLTDFWRRINIYWKDFMVKLVYFPLYFRLRRRGETTAQVVATLSVFAVTWFLHAWQSFWITGTFLLATTDVTFWAVLGVLVVINLLAETRDSAAKYCTRDSAANDRTRAGAAKDRAAPPAAAAPIVRALKIGGTFLLLSTLWSMWHADSMREWFDLLTWWKVGD